jgi:hypothetical protein
MLHNEPSGCIKCSYLAFSLKVIKFQQIRRVQIISEFPTHFFEGVEGIYTKGEHFLYENLKQTLVLQSRHLWHTLKKFKNQVLAHAVRVKGDSTIIAKSKIISTLNTPIFLLTGVGYMFRPLKGHHQAFYFKQAFKTPRTLLGSLNVYR